VRRGAGVSHGREVPLLPVLALLRDYFGISDADSPAQARERVSDRLFGLGPDLRDDLPLLFDFLDIPDPGNPAAQLGAEARMRRVFEVLRRVTARRSERELLVLVIEDLHWFDPQSEAFLERLIENSPGSRTLVLTNFRPEVSAAWMRHSYYQQISLAPLSPESVAEMLTDLLGDHPSLAPLPAYLVERTGGNPFFVEEVVRALIGDGSLVGETSAYRLTRPLQRAGLPPSVQAVLAARIDRLGTEHKLVLQSAAVIGRTFAEAVLARVVGQAVETLASSLSALCAAELLQEARRYPVPEYRFWHALTQEVAYGTLLSDRRARLHAAVADALVDLGADHLDEEAAVVAWHWERAGRRLEAARWSMRAARFALRSDVREALRQWRATVEFLADVEETPASVELGVRARMQLIRIGARVGTELEESRRLEAEGTALAERLGDPAMSGLMGLASGNARIFAGDVAGGLTVSLESARRGEDAEDPDVRAALLSAPIYALAFAGPLSEGLTWADRGIAACAGDAERGAALVGASVLARDLFFRALVLTRIGRLREAATDAEHSLTLAGSRGETETLCSALTLRTLLAWLCGEGADTTTVAAEAVRLSEETGNAATLVGALDALAQAHLIAGRSAEAAAACQRALVVGREKRSGLCLEASVLAHLALARLACGDRAAAEEAADDAVDRSRRQGARVLECFALLTRAHVASADPAAGEGALADLNAALVLATGETRALTYEPFIREEIGRLRGEETELREARRLYAAIGSTGHAARLTAELAEPAAHGAALPGAMPPWPPPGPPAPRRPPA
jgi:hypothetical protein